MPPKKAPRHPPQPGSARGSEPTSKTDLFEAYQSLKSNLEAERVVNNVTADNAGVPHGAPADEEGCPLLGVWAKGLEVHEKLFNEPNVTPDSVGEFIRWLEADFHECLWKHLSPESRIGYIYMLLVHLLFRIRQTIAVLPPGAQDRPLWNSTILAGPELDLSLTGKIVGAVSEILKSHDSELGSTKPVNATLLTAGWSNLVIDLLDTSKGGAFLGSSPTTSLAELLWLIVMDTKLSAGREAITGRDTGGLGRLAKLFFTSRIANVSLYLARCIARCLPVTSDVNARKGSLKATFQEHVNGWDETYWKQLFNLFGSLIGRQRYMPKTYKQILNVTARGMGAAGSRPRGFELVTLEVDGKSILDSEVCRKHLETGNVVMYIDPECLIVKAFSTDGLEEDVYLAYKQMRSFREQETAPGNFTYLKIPGIEGSYTKRISFGVKQEDSERFLQELKLRVGEAAFALITAKAAPGDAPESAIEDEHLDSKEPDVSTKSSTAQMDRSKQTHSTPVASQTLPQTRESATARSKTKYGSSSKAAMKKDLSAKSPSVAVARQPSAYTPATTRTPQTSLGRSIQAGSRAIVAAERSTQKVEAIRGQDQEQHLAPGDDMNCGATFDKHNAKAPSGQESIAKAVNASAPSAVGTNHGESPVRPKMSIPSIKAKQNVRAQGQNLKQQDIALPAYDGKLLQNAPDETDFGVAQGDQRFAFGSDFDEGSESGCLAESTQAHRQKKAGPGLSSPQDWRTCGENVGKKYRQEREDDLRLRVQPTLRHGGINEVREAEESESGNELVEAIHDAESLTSVEIPKEILKVIKTGFPEDTLKQPADEGSLTVSLTGRHGSLPAKASNIGTSIEITAHIPMRASSAPNEDPHAHRAHPAYHSAKPPGVERITEEPELEEDSYGRSARANKAKSTPELLGRLPRSPSVRSKSRNPATGNQARGTRVTMVKRGLEHEEVTYSPSVKKARISTTSRGGRASIGKGEGVMNATTDGMENSVMDVMQLLDAIHKEVKGQVRQRLYLPTSTGREAYGKFSLKALKTVERFEQESKNTLDNITGKKNDALAKLDDVTRSLEDVKDQVSNIAKANSAAIEAGTGGFDGNMIGRLFD